ncbi:hypothetical protein ACGFZH_35120 [Streptomyces zaomyceticus]
MSRTSTGSVDSPKMCVRRLAATAARAGFRRACRVRREARH